MTALVILLVLLGGLGLGIAGTIRYFKAAITLYRAAMKGEYTFLVVTPDNPYLEQAAMWLGQGELDIREEERKGSASRPQLSLVDGGDDE